MGLLAMRFFKEVFSEIKNMSSPVKRYWLADKGIITISISLFCFYTIFSIDLLSYLFIAFGLGSIVFHYISNKKADLRKLTCLFLDTLLLIVLGLIFGMIMSIGHFFVLGDYSKTLYSLFFLIYLFIVLFSDLF